MKNVDAELEKLAAMEELGGIVPGFSPERAMSMMFRRPLLSEKRSSLAGSRAPAVIAKRFLNGGASKAEREVAEGSMPKWMSQVIDRFPKTEKTSQLNEFMDYAETVLPVNTEGSSEDTTSVMDFVLRHNQRKRFMTKAVRSNANGRYVRPPAWWEGSSEDWQNKLDQATKRYLANEMFSQL